LRPRCLVAESWSPVTHAVALACLQEAGIQDEKGTMQSVKSVKQGAGQGRHSRRGRQREATLTGPAGSWVGTGERSLVLQPGPSGAPQWAWAAPPVLLGCSIQAEGDGGTCDGARPSLLTSSRVPAWGMAHCVVHAVVHSSIRGTMHCFFLLFKSRNRSYITRRYEPHTGGWLVRDKFASC